MIRILIADDHPAIIEGVSRTLTTYGIEVVGSASRAEEVLDVYRACRPDVVVLDVRFGPGQSGLDVARELIAGSASAKVVIYTQFDQDEIIHEAYRAGCKGVVTKARPTADLAQAIKSAAEDRTYFLPEIAERLALMSVRADDSPLHRLTPREIDVWRHIAKGSTLPEIAEDLSLSIKTVSLTSQSVKEKLGTDRPAELALMAVRYKLIEP